MTGDKVTWRCHHCNEAIGPGDGYLGIDIESLHSYEAAAGGVEVGEAGADEETLAELLDSPEELQWFAYHTSCRPDMDNEPYAIPVEEISTTRGLLRWTGQLGPKPWLRHTDWFEIIANLSDPPPP